MSAFDSLQYATVPLRQIDIDDISNQSLDRIV